MRAWCMQACRPDDADVWRQMMLTCGGTGVTHAGARAHTHTLTLAWGRLSSTPSDLLESALVFIFLSVPLPPPIHRLRARMSWYRET